MQAYKIVGITMGDPGGIGPEVVVKALLDRSLWQDAVPLIIGSRAAFEPFVPSGFRPVPLNEASFKIQKNEIHFLDVTEDAKKLLPAFEDGFAPSIERGKVSRWNAALALASIEKAAGLAIEKKIGSIATAPVNKTSIRSIVPEFHGHTEYFADKAGTSRFAMMFVGPRFHVTLATVHIPIKKVSSSLSKELILEKIILTNNFLTQYMAIENPKIAVCALNPHGEETGSEEAEIIRPSVEEARKRGINVLGPFSADQLFYEAYHGHYDSLISMYHDQGLAPFKMIAFNDGVNVTLGLPFIRTSPDHGTAFDIAGHDKADASSMAASIKLALRLAENKARFAAVKKS